MARTAHEKTNGAKAKLYVAFELSQKNWRVVCSDGLRSREAAVPARDLSGVLKLIGHTRTLLGTGPDVLTCYEAGRDGFWLHRALADQGIENVVLDAASIEVDRRARRAKTDRLDGRKLVALLIRRDHGDMSIRCVNVPSPEVEDARRVERELLRLKNERTAHTNRVRGLLALVGRSPKRLKCVRELLELGWRGADHRPIPPGQRDEILRELERIDLLNTQIRAVQRALREQAKTDTPCAATAAQLAKVGGVGPVTAAILSYEFLGWRDFENRRQVASAAGLTPTPYSSGNDEREQGISKAGNRRVRWITVQLAWVWLRRQPNSRLTRWYQERFGGGSPRLRRIGVVALARRLLVDLWRYAKHGVVPEGALMKA
jgi:transposase